MAFVNVDGIGKGVKESKTCFASSQRTAIRKRSSKDKIRVDVGALMWGFIRFPRVRCHVCSGSEIVKRLQYSSNALGSRMGPLEGL